jgi:hypothetical protein
MRLQCITYDRPSAAPRFVPVRLLSAVLLFGQSIRAAICSKVAIALYRYDRIPQGTIVPSRSGIRSRAFRIECGQGAI